MLLFALGAFSTYISRFGFIKIIHRSGQEIYLADAHCMDEELQAVLHINKHYGFENVREKGYTYTFVSYL